MQMLDIESIINKTKNQKQLMKKGRETSPADSYHQYPHQWKYQS